MFDTKWFCFDAYPTRFIASWCEHVWANVSYATGGSYMLHLRATERSISPHFGGLRWTHVDARNTANVSSGSLASIASLIFKNASRVLAFQKHLCSQHCEEAKCSAVITDWEMLSEMLSFQPIPTTPQRPLQNPHCSIFPRPAPRCIGSWQVLLCSPSITRTHNSSII